MAELNSDPNQGCTTDDCSCCGGEEALARLESAITAYYDNLSDEEVEEQRLWGEFCESQLVLIYEADSVLDDHD